ncbi:hypothetical protein EON65_32865, partial [archaeon]
MHHSSIHPFDQSNFHRFLAKMFKNDKEYRIAVFEAICVAQEHGVEFNETTLNHIAPYANELSSLQPEQCAVCQGSRWSGDLLSCAFCEQSQVHWHCFRPDDGRAHDKGYVCLACCRRRGWEAGRVLDLQEGGEGESEEREDG